MTTIYLIRHGETEANQYRRIQGWLDTKVSKHGMRQIEGLSQRFSSIEIHAVYSSDLSRAVATAKAISGPHDLTLHTDTRLREINMGSWAGCPWDELVQNDRERTELFLALSPTWQAPGGEGFEEVRMRMDKVLKEIASHHNGQSVAVVSHGAAIRQMLAMFHGLSVSESGQIPLGANTSFSVLEFDGETVHIVSENDASHLEQISASATICP